MDERVFERGRDYAGAKIGMWLFLLTEAFIFFGPLLLYSIFRRKYGADFAAASKELDIFAGAFNTIALLTSSLAMASSVSAVKKGRGGLSVLLLALTMALGAVFMANKYFEWGEKIGRGLYPGSREAAALPPGKAMFYSLYFVLTGLHGLHVLAGEAVLGVMAYRTWTGRVSRENFIGTENAGLYWHLVDIIWIFLFPAFYLVSP